MKRESKGNLREVLKRPRFSPPEKEKVLNKINVAFYRYYNQTYMAVSL